MILLLFFLGYFKYLIIQKDTCVKSPNLRVAENATDIPNPKQLHTYLHIKCNTSWCGAGESALNPIFFQQGGNCINHQKQYIYNCSYIKKSSLCSS